MKITTYYNNQNKYIKFKNKKESQAKGIHNINNNTNINNDINKMPKLN